MVSQSRSIIKRRGLKGREWAIGDEAGEDVKEELDPVGKEDGDIDNDGDEDSSDEYLANRRKKISNAVNEEDLDEASTIHCFLHTIIFCV